MEINEWLKEKQRKLERAGYEFHFPNKIREQEQSHTNGKKAMLLSHQLSRSGAPLALVAFGEFLQQEGWQVVILSPEDGVLKEGLLEKGFPVLLCGKYWNRKIPFCHFAQEFDLVMVNTLLNFPAVVLLGEKKCSVLWWIHEMDNFFELGKGDIPYVSDLADNIQVLAAGGFVQERIRTYLKGEVSVFNVGVEEITEKYNPMVEKERFHFACTGIVSGYKGQWLLLQALLLMPLEYQDKMTISLIGDRKNISNETKELITECQKTNMELRLLDNMPRNVLFQYYNQVNCLVIPSQLESLSMVGVEAMELTMPVICSTGAGLSQYMKDGENGLLFPAGDAKALRDKLKYAMDNWFHMIQMGIQGEKVYLEHFSKEVFWRNTRKWIEGGNEE